MYINKRVLDYIHPSGSSTIVNPGDVNEGSPEKQEISNESMASELSIQSIRSESSPPANTYEVASQLSAGIISEASTENI